MNRIWILGSPDPEMELIERLLDRAAERYVYALGPSSCERARPDEAYRASVGSGAVDAFAEVILVECSVPVEQKRVVRVDHHRLGDPGYGRPPAEFLQASSVGQVAARLWRCYRCGDSLDLRDRSGRYGDPIVGFSNSRDCGKYLHIWSGSLPYRELADEILLAAAADHCLAAAYRGECPGVDPDRLMRWRAESRAKFQGRPVEAILADVERAREALRAAPEINLAPSIAVRDMRGQKIQELPEASAREGMCFVADGLPGKDGRVKVVCQSGTSEQIRAFMEAWGPAEGLQDIYGDPARGFAGGYLSAR